MYVGARRAEYSGFVEREGGVAVATRFQSEQAVHFRRSRARSMLQNDPRGCIERTCADDSGQGSRRGTLIDERPGWIGEDEIERAALRDAPAKHRGVAGDHGRPRLQVERCNIGFDGEKGIAGRLDQNGLPGSSREGLEGQSPAAGVKIEHASPLDDTCRRQDPEQSLTHPIRGGSCSRPPRGTKGTRAMDPASDPHDRLLVSVLGIELQRFG